MSDLGLAFQIVSLFIYHQLLISSVCLQLDPEMLLDNYKLLLIATNAAVNRCKNLLLAPPVGKFDPDKLSINKW